MEPFNSINEINDLVDKFIESIKSLLPLRKIEKPIFKDEPIIAARFPYEIDKKLGTERNGVYIFWTTDNNKLIILYVGKGNIENRFYTHIGKGYCWERCRSKAKFINNFTNDHPYVTEDIQNIITDAKFNVTAITCSDSAISCLIESFLIFALEPRINIDCIGDETLIARKNNKNKMVGSAHPTF